MQPPKLINYLLFITPKSWKLPVEFNFLKAINQLELELLELNSIIDKNRLAIDIGANRGFYSYALSQIFDYVESFEPQPSCNQIIKDYSKKNQKITIHESALSDTNGEIKLHIPIIRGRVNISLATGCASVTPPSCEHTTLEVPVKTLDEYNFQDVDFIKIDVEGHEMQVIEGARGTISKWHPILLIEIEQRHLIDVPIGNIFNKIIDLGYDGFFLQNNQLIDISLFDVKVHQDLSSHKRKYINNFIFKPKEK